MPRMFGPSGEDLDGDGEYDVLPPDKLYRGKSYSEWTTDWLNWFLSADADRRNSGPVVFLRSKGLPNEKTGANISDIPEASHELGMLDNAQYNVATDITGLMTSTKSYVNDPNVKIGGDRLQIFDDQVVFVPIILAYWLKTTAFADWGGMLDYTGLTIDYGDDPPDVDQLTINGEPIIVPPVSKAEIDNRLNTLNSLNAGLRNRRIDAKGAYKGYLAQFEKKIGGSLEDYRITTPIFTAIVPDAGYGRSAKDFIEESPVPPNNYAAMVDGYFVMIKFEKGTYWIHSFASAPREARGPYFSELLYQIEVIERPARTAGKATRWRPSRNERILSQILSQKAEAEDLSEAELNRFRRFCSASKNEPVRRKVK